MLLILDGCSFRSILPESEVLSWIWIVLDFPYVENVIAPLSMSSLQNQTVYWPSALSTSFSWDGVWGARLQRCTMVMTPHSSCASPGISVGHYKVFPHILSHSTKQSSFQTWLWEHCLQGMWWKVGGWVMGWLCEPSSSRATKPNHNHFKWSNLALEQQIGHPIDVHPCTSLGCAPLSSLGEGPAEGH